MRRPAGEGLICCDCVTPRGWPLFIAQRGNTPSRMTSTVVFGDYYTDFRWTALDLRWSDNADRVSGICPQCKRRFDIYNNLSLDLAEITKDAIAQLDSVLDEIDAIDYEYATQEERTRISKLAMKIYQKTEQMPDFRLVTAIATLGIKKHLVPKQPHVFFRFLTHLPPHLKAEFGDNVPNPCWCRLKNDFYHFETVHPRHISGEGLPQLPIHEQ
jgi:hypothetical protein